MHPVRSWTDLKKRVGPDRRCFVYTHNSMPDEPLVVLHTALRSEISQSLTGLTTNTVEPVVQYTKFDKKSVKAAIFYSISATQSGLKGIDLGNYIIKRVAKELKKEFPALDTFSTLSPIPKFKIWLYDKFKNAENNPDLLKHIFKQDDLEKLKSILHNDNVFKELRKQMNSNSWLSTHCLTDTLHPLIIKMCIWYLYFEKKRGYAFCNVGT